MNEIVSTNWHAFFINLIANEDCLPKGGLPIICILSYLFLNWSVSNSKKFCLIISECSGSKS